MKKKIGSVFAPGSAFIPVSAFISAWAYIPLLIFASLLGMISCNTGSIAEKPLDPSMMLWYDEPASEWTGALPLGNGRLGAMVYGGIAEETIQFNEESLWAGQPHDYAHEGACEVLDELRQLLWDGKQDEAHRLANERFMSRPFGQFCYQPFGNIKFRFPGHEEAANYRRILDLRDGTALVSYGLGEVIYKREAFSSEPDQALVLRIEASKKGSLSFVVDLDSPHSDYQVSVEGNVIILKGKADNYHSELDRIGEAYPESKLEFEARLRVDAEGGELVREGNSLKVLQARSATLCLVAATSFVSYQDISGNPAELCKLYMDKLWDASYGELRDRHYSDYNSLMSRVELDLGESELSYRTTDERLVSFTRDEDPSLVSLLFQYGRYLLISSSRPGTQPANLQGIWNEDLAPPWDSKYTININTEMNYWLSEITNLPELSDPLIAMVEDLSVTGRNVAREHYNLGGWVAHHNTDIWRGAAPINSSDHGIWVVGGAWLAQHLWWHYQFSGDREYLKNRAYPVLKGASEFFMDYLVSDPKHPGWLVSGPGNSPENGGLVMGPTMDHQIIRNLFMNTAEAARVLGVDEDFAERLDEKRARIAPNQIGQYGQLQEWLEDLDDPGNRHRHVSHLWGLHPGNEIHPLTTPELAEACRVTLSHRGDGGTGWSRAWKINFWARLLDGDHSFMLLRNLMVPAGTETVDYGYSGGLYMNLFDAHPPFQIDGNFGATSGITEMLLQSHLRDSKGDYYLDILPALPEALSEGKISGIRGRGGFELEIEWQSGELVRLVVKSLKGNVLNVRYKGKLILKETLAGESYTFTAEDFL